VRVGQSGLSDSIRTVVQLQEALKTVQNASVTRSDPFTTHRGAAQGQLLGMGTQQVSADAVVPPESALCSARSQDAQKMLG
jgi:hypothetical protein